METSAISVVIPAYNHERFVGAAIESVLSQTFQDFDLIVIDDGSTDRTADVVRGFKDRRIQYHHQENQDAYSAINRGLHLARGRYVAILNSDDVYAKTRLERLVREQQATNAECIFTHVQPIDEDGHEIVGDGHYWHAWHERNRRFCFECGDLYAGFLRGNLMVTTSNLFLTARAVKTVGDFAPIRYLHDYDYIFRVMLAFPGKVHYLHDDKLLFYRIHGGNTLSQGAVVAREQDQQLIRKYMLAGVPEEVRKRAGTGADRLVELEQELFAVKSALGIHSPRWAARIASELRKRIRKLTT